MSFLDLLALRKAKLGGKYTAPVGQSGDQDAGEVEEEVRTRGIRVVETRGRT